jgi:hypothetical protein
MDTASGSDCTVGARHEEAISGIRGRLDKVEQVTDKFIQCLPEITQTAASVAEIKETLKATSAQGYDYKKALLTAVVTIVVAIIGYLGVVYKVEPAATASLKSAVADGVAQGVAAAAKQ